MANLNKGYFIRIAILLRQFGDFATAKPKAVFQSHTGQLFSPSLARETAEFSPAAVV